MKVLVLIVFLLKCFHTKAQLVFSSELPNSIDIVIGYKKNGQWVSTGYYNLKGRFDTVTLFSNGLQGKYFYFFARDSNGYTWSGEYDFCIKEKYAFTDVVEKNCEERGLVNQGFRQIETYGCKSYHVRLFNQHILSSAVNEQIGASCGSIYKAD